MTIRTFRSLLWLSATLAGFQPVLAAERETVGATERVQAEAVAVHDDGERDLNAGSPVLFDDTLRTGDGARLLARLEDGTAVTLGENASIHIDSFVYEPAAGKGRLALDVIEGSFLFIGGAVEGMSDSEVSIATPVATIGIRGTTVWGGPIDGGYGVQVFAGEVTVTTETGSVVLGAGDATMIEGAVLQPPAPWDDARTTRATAAISFSE